MSVNTIRTVRPAIEKSALANAYESVLILIGASGVLLPIGDDLHIPSDTTFKTVGGEQSTFTWSKALSAFDTPPSKQGLVPVITLNGTDEQANTPDAAFWSRNDASSEAFSIGLWAKITNTATVRTLFAKWDRSSGNELREWALDLDSSDKLRFRTADESANVFPQRLSSIGINMGAYHLYVVTYDGSGGASNMDGAILYEDGAVIASTATNNGSYVAMEDTVTLPRLGSSLGIGGADENLFVGEIAGGPLGPFFLPAVLPADSVLRLFEIGRRYLDL